MELVELEKIAERENINLINFKMHKNKARIINYDSCYIFMDYSKIKTLTEEKCLLAEELGHYYYDAYYTLSSDQNTIDRQEYKALKWKSLSLVSLKDVRLCFYKRYNKLFRHCRRITSRA